MAQYGSIKENNVNFRTAPGLSSTIIRQLHKGYFVTVTYNNRVYKDGYWWVNIIYNGTSGWIADIYLEYYY